MISKLNNLVCIEIQREGEVPIQAQQINTGNRTTTNKQTSTTTADVYREGASSEAEVQQLLYDHQCFEANIQEAIQEDKDQHDDSVSDSGTDTEMQMPVLVGRLCHDASSDDDTSDGSYGYHTGNDNSSIEDNDDESDNTIPGLQEQNRDDSSSNGDSVYNQNHECDHTPVAKHQSVLQSIDTKPIVNEWRNNNIDGDEYDGNHDDDEISRQSRKYTIPPLRLQGGNGKPLVETVTEEDTKKLTVDQQQHQLSTN